MDRAPGVARIRCEEEGLITVRTFAVLRLHHRIRTFIPATTGLEACDWPSQNEAVQLSAEKAATES